MDLLDEKIIALLDEGTVRPSRIAQHLGEPLSTVHFRIRRMEREHLVRRYRADIDWRQAGYGLIAFILVTTDANLLKSLKKTQDGLLDDLLSLRFVREGHIITGEADLLLKVIARDPAHLKDLLLTHIDAKAGVVRTRTIIALE